ncbi:hypothetical protein L210DRAFT_72241 [Boletus edulis BED1]|uniref:Uncharacterized protein n=1 Tax=Boletus edulis BED1 TaxID=1328754 RepID=A0AAD4BC32_BOLED|nr:hypothetical protein L210DRAFT_72241 [Boletus edulis BED1]
MIFNHTVVSTSETKPQLVKNAQATITGFQNILGKNVSLSSNFDLAYQKITHCPLLPYPYPRRHRLHLP